MLGIQRPESYAEMSKAEDQSGCDREKQVEQPTESLERTNSRQ